MKKTNPEELLAAYAAGGLSEAERAEVEAYLESSPQAREELEALRAVIDDVQDAGEAGPSPHLGAMRASISMALDEVDREREQGFWRLLRSPRLAPILAGALVAAAALALVFFRGSGAGPTPGGESVADHRATDSGTGTSTDLQPAEDLGEELFAADGDAEAELEILPEDDLDAVDEELLAALEEVETADVEAQFYLALYWAQAVAAQDTDTDLAKRFEQVAADLAAAEETIVGELNGAQGPPQSIGGYYRPDVALAEKAMRPSATFNALIDAI